MTDPGSGPIWLRDSRLAPFAVCPLPVWLWAGDASRVLWANPTGTAILEAATASALAAYEPDPDQPAAAQIRRLAASLPSHGARLERMRGFGAEADRRLTCACSQFAITGEDDAGVLVVATEPTGPDLTLPERLQRLLTDTDQALAFFAPDGMLLCASVAAHARLNGAASLSALGSNLAINRIEAGGDTVLVATFEPDAAATPAPTTALASADESPEAAEPQPRSAPPTSAPPAPMSERRHPLRFVWQVDHEGHFTIDSDEFVALVGPRTAAAIGRPWSELVDILGLDPEGRVARAMATRETWSRLSVAWPVDDREERLTTELSGLPVFDRDRAFRGYRGFGLCRDLAGLGGSVQYPPVAVATETSAPAESEPDVAPEAPSPPRAAEISERPVLTLVPQAENVVPFRSPAAEGSTAMLSPVEHHAFHELSRRINERLNGAAARPDEAAPLPAQEAAVLPPQAPASEAAELHPSGSTTPSDFDDVPDEAAERNDQAIRRLLDRFPVGVLVYRLNHLIYANRAFLEWTGYRDLNALVEAGGLDSLLVEPGAIAIEHGGRKTFSIFSAAGTQVPAEGRLFLVPWDGDSAFALVTIPAGEERQASSATADAARAEIAELKAILDTATDGVIVLDREARIVSSNRSAQALFGYDAEELAGRAFIDLLAPESVDIAIDYLDRMQGSGVASLLNDGRDVIGRERQGGLIPLFMTMGRLGEGSHRFCAVFRDITPWKRTEEELLESKRQAEKASSAKSDFLAKISHEIRTPLNAIIGFSEVMMEERFGPVGNDRYRQYLRDIHTSGGHLLSLVNDLLDLSKIEAGKVELSFTDVSLNDVTQQCVAIMQPQANRERIIIRTSLSPKLPHVLADARSVRQIVLNLLSNSIKFTNAGGQVIVSTAHTDQGDVVVRVRDTGVGMSEKDIATALEPFRQLTTSTRWGSGGTGLGLPLTKALAEANRARFAIKSTPNSGTLVEVVFPAARVLTA